MKVPSGVHTSRPWRVREIARDFEIEDVWELRAPGASDDLAQAVAMMAEDDPARSPLPIVRGLFSLRWKLGGVFGWDRPGRGLGSRAHSLRDRLPPDLRAAPGPKFAALPFTSLYLLDDEFAAEIANQTMHGIIHLARVPAGDGSYRCQMTVYVKPNGFFGRAYMLAIRPFRYLIYPLMMRDFERRWRARSLHSHAASKQTAPSG